MPASKLIVINTGGAFRPKALSESGLRFEVASLMLCKDVLRDVSTSLRRRYLVDIFEKASQQDDLRGRTRPHRSRSLDRAASIFCIAERGDAATGGAGALLSEPAATPGGARVGGHSQSERRRQDRAVGPR